jgi:N-acetylmuramoyl-L-alanine amidase/FG-GAP-like repeat
MRCALPRLAGTSAVVLGSFALVVPMASGLPAAAVVADAAPGNGGVASSAVTVPRSAPATLVTPVAAEAVTPEVVEVPVPDADAPGAPLRAAQSAPEPVEGFGVVGVTWQGQEPRALQLQVRTEDDGTWSDWQELHHDADHAPDPGTAEARAARTRAGTDPLVVGDVDRVQVRATSASGEAPRDLELSVVDPGTSAADAPAGPVVESTVGALGTAGTAGSAMTASRALYTGDSTALASQVAVTNPPGVRAPRPVIRTRRAWGARESLRSGTPDYGTVRAGFVHHTVNANRYSRSQVPAIIRGIYAYHTQSNGWSDIGYNFLIDRFGRIWQGRFGDLRRNVIGAHTYGYNHVSFAASAIGNFEKGRPSPEMIRAYGRLMGWRLGKWGIAAGSLRRILEGRRFKAINGHRDADATACPGLNLYRRIGDIRRVAVSWQRGGTAPAPDPAPSPDPAPEPEPTPPPTTQVRPEQDRLRDFQADGFPDLLARSAATARLNLLVGDGGPGFRARRVADQEIGQDVLFTGVGDVTGDRRPDLLVRNGKSKVTRIRRGRADGTFGRPTGGTRRFDTADVLAGVGQMIGTRRPDLLVREAATGHVWLYPGRADGRWGRKHLLIRRAGGLTLLRGAGDLNRDGRADVLGRDGGRLLLYAGRGRGRVAAPRVIARGWRGKDLAAAGGDVTGDGTPDLVAREHKTGRTYIHLTRPNGTVSGRFGGWRRWRDLNRLTGIGDVTGDRTPDLLGRTRGGSLVVLPAKGTRWLQGPLDTGKVAENANFVQVVGDWNDDGHADVVTRGVEGSMWLYPGNDQHGLDPHVRLATGWAERSLLVAPGDMNKDGHPDLVSRDTDGRIWVHPGDGVTGLLERYLAREQMFRTDLVAAAGFWTSDAARDLVVRRATTKDLYVVPGTDDGTLGQPVRLAGGGRFGAYDKIVGVGDFNGDKNPDILARERERGRLWLFPGSTTGGLGERKFVAAGMNQYDLIG